MQANGLIRIYTNFLSKPPSVVRIDERPDSDLIDCSQADFVDSAITVE